MNGYISETRSKLRIANENVKGTIYQDSLENNRTGIKIFDLYTTWNSLKTILRNFFVKNKPQSDRNHIFVSKNACTLQKTNERRPTLKTVYGITSCNGGFSLPKTNADICRQECMEKRIVNSRTCCQTRRLGAAPSSNQSYQSCLPHFASIAPSSSPLQTSYLTYQAQPPPQHCPPPCPPRPPCPPAISTPLKCSDYLHTTTECFPNSGKSNPCRWDNTTCYNEGSDTAGNTIKQWNTRCQFASKTPTEYSTNQRSAATATAATTSKPSDCTTTSDSSSALNNNTTNYHNRSSCYSRDQRTSDTDLCFRKCKKELMIHFPSGKCGTEPQLRRSAKLSNVTPSKVTTSSSKSNVSLKSNTEEECFDRKSVVTKSPKTKTVSLTAATTSVTTTRVPTVTTAINAVRKFDQRTYCTQISLADDKIVPAVTSTMGQESKDTFNNHASHSRWLENKRKLYFQAKPSLTEPAVRENHSANLTSSYYRKKCNQ